MNFRLGETNFNQAVTYSQRLLTCCPATAKTCDVISSVSISNRNPYRPLRQCNGIPCRR